MKVNTWCNVCRKETLEVDDKFKVLLTEENDELLDEMFAVVSQMVEDQKGDNEHIDEVFGIFDAETDECILEI